MVGVHATGRLKVSQVKVTTSVLNALPQYVQHTSIRNLVADTGNQLLRRGTPVLDFELLINLGLGISDKLQHFIGN